MYSIDFHFDKDRYFTIGDNKHQKFAFCNNHGNYPPGLHMAYQCHINLMAIWPYPQSLAKLALSSFLAYYGHFTPGANRALSPSSGPSLPFCGFGNSLVFSIQQGICSPKACIWLFKM
ncbi:hypothetical protein O181_030104 [Austropuccinia psidii MF-1]|uniref:Uncharacterized protein n=1 Tax=Austropuccinia psidii MF-1 TaxID=1389203 RepID=A0A9Q3H582_9BASI|nr:hypothetical protein [Austropuccinia psidii MF-1]